MARRKKAAEWHRNNAAEALVPALRKHHPHLNDATIVALSGPLPKGILGRARRPRDTEVALIEATGGQAPDYVIDTDSDFWEHASMEQRLALVDHEMCHFSGRKEDKEGNLGKWQVRTPHDVEEFAGVVIRHGLWRSDLKVFVDLANSVADNQRTLPLLSQKGAGVGD